MPDTIFRLTAPGDTEASIDSGEKIIFNTGIVPDATGKLVKTGFRMVSDLNPHPNPNKKLNFIQDSLLGVIEVTIAGYFIDHNFTLGPRNLYNWSVDEDTNNDFRAGRFGLNISSFNGLLNQVPTVGLNGTGYMLSDIDVQDVEDPRTEVPFIATFFRNGSINTVGKSVLSIPITNGGSGYTSPPSVTVPTPAGGRAATILAVITAGVITSLTITDKGRGYLTPPTVTIDNSGSGGSGLAVGTVVLT